MGALSAALFQSITDRLAARVEEVISGSANTLSANAETGLGRTLDEGTDDLLMKQALLDELVTADRQLLAPNYKTFLHQLLGNNEWKQVHRAIADWVTDSNGNDAASFAAFLSAVSATVHPIYAEVARKVSGTAFMLSGAVVGAMHPYMQTRAFDRVLYGTEGSLADATAATSNPDDPDTTVIAASGDIIALGSRYKFGYILLDLPTLATGDVGLTAEYWDGTSMQTVSLTDRTTGLSVNGGIISFTIPDDWVPFNKDTQGTPVKLHDAAEEELYYIILTGATTQATDPVVNWFQHIPEAVYYSGTTLYGVPQPPLALCRITAADAMTVTPIQSADHTRFVVPDDAVNALKFRAITGITGTVIVTFAFVDGAGASKTELQASWGSPAADGTHNVTLGTNTGVRSVPATGHTKAGTATAGVFVVEASAYNRTVSTK